MGLGNYLSKKFSGAKSSAKQSIRDYKETSETKRLRNKALNREVEEARWEAHRKRKLAEAKTQHPSRAVRVMDSLASAGASAGKASQGVGGGFDVDPYGGFGSGGKGNSGFGGGGVEFTSDPFSFSGVRKSENRKTRSSRKRRDSRKSKRGGVHIYVEK